MERDITKEIERLRELMIQSAKEVGFTHPSVIFFSRKIDSLHNLLLASQNEKSSRVKAHTNSRTFLK